MHKDTLEKANDAVRAGDHETFLSFCTDDTEWNFVGDQVLQGKEAVRQYLAKAYVEPPKFEMNTMIEEGDMLTAVGHISLLEDGKWNGYSACDVWEFREGKMAKLRAFVIPD